jgi:hypothetical protein
MALYAINATKIKKRKKNIIRKKKLNEEAK